MALEDLSLESVFDAAKAANPPDVAPVPEITPAAQAEAQPTGQASQPTAAPSTPAASKFTVPQMLSARAATAGLNFEGIDSQERLNEYLLDQYVQARPYADYGRSALSQPSQVAQHPGAEPEEDEDADSDTDIDDFDLDGHFSSLWSAPQLDDQAKFAIDRGLVQIDDESGLYVPAPGPFQAQVLPIINGLNQAHIAQKQQMQKLFEGNFYKNTYEAILPALKHALSKDFSRLSEESVKTYEQQSFQDQFATQHKSWLYTPEGQLSEKGNAFRQAVQALRAGGMNDPKQLAEWALLKIGGAPQVQPEQQVTQPLAGSKESGQPVETRQRDEHGRYLPAGTPAPAAPPVTTKQESFIDEARRKAAASNSSQGSYTDSGSDFVPSNDGELENMFSNSWRKHRAGAAA
jgi:hypothetical protein